MKIENANISFDSYYFLIEFSMFSRFFKDMRLSNET